MKKLILITITVLLVLFATINIGASSVSSVVSQWVSSSNSILSHEHKTSSESSQTTTASGISQVVTAPYESSNTQPIASRMTQEEFTSIITSQSLEYAEKFYTEAEYIDAQESEANAALANIYQSLYLDQNGETDETKLVKQKAMAYIESDYTGLSFMDGSVMLMNYVSLTDFKKTGEITFDSTYTFKDNCVYTALVKDKDERVVLMIQLLPVEGDIQGIGYVGECTDLKAHAVKAYDLLKTTDLDLSKTQATLFQMNGFELMYYLTDGTSCYFLTFGSTNKAAGDLYYNLWDHPDEANHEARMRVLKYDDMLKLIQSFDTSSMTDRPINQTPAPMGGETDDAVSVTTTPVGETTDTDIPVQESSNSVWLWAIVIVAVAALAIVVVMVFRKKKKAN